MPNLTMSIEEEILKKARKVAVERDTTVTAMVREFLRRVAGREEQTIDGVVAELRKCFRSPGMVVGRRTWKREDLHER